MAKHRKAADVLPLTPSAFHVLVALADGDKHGYAVLKDVKRRTSGRVVLTAGTLYGVVRRLLAEGLIVESDERPDPSLDDERRRYYALTAFGREVVSAEADRLAEMVDLARAKRLVSRGH